MNRIDQTISDIDEVVQELRYSSYATQREKFPETSPERWGLIYPDWQTFEARYQMALSVLLPEPGMEN